MSRDIMKVSDLMLALFLLICLIYVLQASKDLMKENGLTLSPFQLIICLDYVLRMTIELMKENGLTLK